MDFYQAIKGFNDFTQFSDESHYSDVPNDWFLIISDIESSTDLFDRGSYKLINMIGASTIVAVANALKTLDFPMVFGGDGATVLVPNDKIEIVKSYLATTVKNSYEEFNVKIRIGCISMAEIYQNGLSVQIAKFCLAGGPSISFLKGNGLDWFEKKVKSGFYHLSTKSNVDLVEVMAGLSCRWAPIKNSQGLILTLIVKAVDDSHCFSELVEIIKKIDGIVSLNEEKANPIHSSKMSLGNFDVEANLENKLTRSSSVVKIKIKMLITLFMRFFNIKIDGIGLQNYLADNASHSDFKKYDGTVKLVIDCNINQKNLILELLKRSFESGKIYYGFAESESALITCFVKKYSQGQHIHFVDGNNGGYTLASKTLKQQMQNRHEKEINS